MSAAKIYPSTIYCPYYDSYATWMWPCKVMYVSNVFWTAKVWYKVYIGSTENRHDFNQQSHSTYFWQSSWSLDACNKCSKNWPLWNFAGGSRGCEMSESYTIKSKLDTSGRAVNKKLKTLTLAHLQRKYTDNWLIALHKGLIMQETFPCEILPIF